MSRVPAAVLVGVLVVLSACAPAVAGSTGGGGAILAHSDGAGMEPDGAGSHFIRWVGHFHPPITAFPIAMLVGAAVAEALRIVTKAAWLEAAGRFCVILGATTAVIAA